MECRYCFGQNTVKRGRRSGRQQHLCKDCRKHYMESYLIDRMNPDKDAYLVRLHCGGMETRGIAKEMGISRTCVMKAKLRIATTQPQPELVPGQVYQVDELVTFVAWEKKPRPKPGKKNKRDSII